MTIKYYQPKNTHPLSQTQTTSKPQALILGFLKHSQSTNIERSKRNFLHLWTLMNLSLPMYFWTRAKAGEKRKLSCAREK